MSSLKSSCNRPGGHGTVLFFNGFLDGLSNAGSDELTEFGCWSAKLYRWTRVRRCHREAVRYGSSSRVAAVPASNVQVIQGSGLGFGSRHESGDQATVSGVSVYDDDDVYGSFCLFSINLFPR